MTRISVRASIAILIIIITSFYSLANMASEYSVVKPLPANPDEVSLYERRLSPVRERLSACEKVGYASGQVAPGIPLSNQQSGVKDFYLARYVLAPALVVVVDETTDCVVVNSLHPDVESEMIADYNLIVADDFENGVRVFRKDS